MIENSFAKKIYKNFIQIQLKERQSSNLIIGIDGPTASGKTILADNLKNEIEKNGKSCFIYRLDWALISRKQRLLDLEEINNTKSIMEYENALHMRLHMVEDFLKEIRNAEYLKKRKTISLKNLYSREDKGRTIGKSKFKFDPKAIIILEGHYTSETRLSRYIDFNIMLLGECEVLINRKKNRVKDYRKSNDVEDYFNRIDLPSFRKHLSNFSFGSDIVVDNTDHLNPIIKNHDYLLSWIKKYKVKGQTKIGLKLHDIMKCIFSCSLQSNVSRNVLIKCINELMDWDKKICEYLTISIDHIREDLTAYAKQIINNLNKINKKKGIQFEVIHTNAIHNIYKRKLPVTLGVNIEFKKTEKQVQLLMEVKNNSINFRLVWDGGSSKIKIDRELGAEINYQTMPIKLVYDNHKFQKTSKINVFTPTHYLIPSFLKDNKYNVILTDHEEENVSSVSCINDLINNFGIWIRRFATFKELYFFQTILVKVGIDCINIGNYLIACRLPKSILKKKFKQFCFYWDTSFQSQTLDKKGSKSYDKICENEREYVKKFVEKNCSDFVYLDEKLYCKRNMQSENFKKIKNQIQKMLLSHNRLLRKKVSKLIDETFPNLKLNTSKYWEDIKVKDNKLVNYSEILELQPSILAEIYLWTNIRGDNSAILASNIYDIKGTSLDCYAFLSSSFKNKTPIVLQASLNAIGQSENYNGSNIQGYLMPKNGVLDFVSAATRSARDFFLDTGITSILYGIGLDHINYENDKPSGRAGRFVLSSINSGLVTHYVIDGSKKFKIKKEDDESYKKAFDPVIDYALSLIDKVPEKKHYIFDKEICAGELNYLENKTKALLPSPEQFKIFADVYRKKIDEKRIYSLLKRPMLFIGNLGTTHHGNDISIPKVELAEKWKKKIQRYNFISAVLHGTTKTHSDYLKRSTSGCHKVNVAGDFLDTLVKSLPADLYETLLKSKKEIKKALHLIYPKLKKLEKIERNKIISALENHCSSIQKNINSPKLSHNDISYFKYRPYKYTKRQAKEIVDEIFKRLKKKVINKSKKNKLGLDFSASMIEVPFNDFYKNVVKSIYQEGIFNFHIDVGDGKFITRKINAIKKVEYLRKKFKKLNIHCHLMVESPHRLKTNRKSYIEEYIQAGCDKIALHERSFEDNSQLVSGINMIKKYNAQPGIIIETYRSIDESLIKLLIENKIEWVVIMGVVVGYGGQIFDNKIISKINSIKSYFESMNRNIIVEVDGGLTEDNINMCIDAGANILSGWSIVKSSSVKGILEKVRRINKICGK